MVTKQDLADGLAGLEGRIAKQIAELSDVTMAGFETMNNRFDRLESRMDSLEQRLANLELKVDQMELRMTVFQRELRQINERLDRFDGRIEAIENDIKEIYVFIAKIRESFAAQLAADAKQEGRLKKLEAFAHAVARRARIKFS